MKNIAILVYSLTAGGAERIAGLLSKYLSQKYKVYLFMYNVNVITYDYEGIIVDCSMNGPDKVEQTLLEMKKKYCIDYTISFAITMNLFNLRTRVNDKIIISNRRAFGEQEDYPYSAFSKMKKWYGEADRIVSCSYGAAYDLIHNYGIDEDIITPIYNFIDKEKIVQKAKLPMKGEILSFAGDSKLILNVGRLEKQKNQHKLLVQFAKLLNEGYDVKLIILGQGSLEKELKNDAKRLGIRDKVWFETYCENPFPYYKLADIMAASTDSEGLPNVVLEAMTLGLPVVSTDCLSGPLELIKGCRDYSKRIEEVEVCERGVLVPKKESDTIGTTAYLADGIKLLLEDQKLCDKISVCQQKYMEDYENSKIFDSWLEAIESTDTNQKIPSREKLDELKSAKKVIVYGAGVFGQSIMKYILTRKWQYELLCFAVTNKQDNPEEIEGIPVYQLDELLKYKEDAMVVIGTSEIYERELKDNLDQYGFHYIFSDL